MSRTPDRHRRLRAIFDAALLQEPSMRAAFVHRACENDPEIGPEVLRLLLAHEDTRSFLDHPPELLRSAILSEEEFTGTWRFRVMRRLGAGGMGVVYEVQDRIRDDVVALKTVRQTGAADLYRLKREFRSLADVAHQNLVCLYELFVEDDHRRAQTGAFGRCDVRKWRHPRIHGTRRNRRWKAVRSGRLVQHRGHAL
jgi:hypothetical protein